MSTRQGRPLGNPIAVKLDVALGLTYRRSPPHIPQSRAIAARQNMIDTKRLCFSYDADRPALCDVDLTICPGERLAVIGPNGSGKSTLARCLNGLLQPGSGSVVVDGLSSTEDGSLVEIRRRVAMVFQNPDEQLVSTTVETEIAFGLENLGMPHSEMRERVEETIRAFNLTSHRYRPPHLLSGGEKQRVAVASCVALRPRYLILDEPTALLDPRSRQVLNEQFEELRDQYGIATVHITQIPDEAAMADRVVVLVAGRVLMDCPPEEVYADVRRLEEIGLGLPFARAVVKGLECGATTAGDCLDIEGLARALAPSIRHPRQQNEVVPEPTPAGPATRTDPDIPRMSTDGLWHLYARLPTPTVALRGVDVSLSAGLAVALIGPSGSGKTTFAQHLNGLLKPSDGRVLLDGEDIWGPEIDTTEVRRKVGLIFQFPELQLFDETVADDVAFGPRNLGCDRVETAGLVRDALELVGLPVDDFGQLSPTSLSGGERRRVAIAGVLAMDPEVLVLDEPTAGLDPHIAEVIARVLRQLRARGRTLLLITHDIDLVAELADRVIVLVDGAVVMSGSVREVLGRADFSDLSGLEPPGAIRLAQALTAQGACLPPGLVRRAEIRDALNRALKRRGAHET